MNKYIGIRFVEAEPAPRAGYEGFFVRYPDGFSSWMPTHSFEDEFHPCRDLPFGFALEALKLGLTVRRSGWRAMNQYLVASIQGGRQVISVQMGDHSSTPWVPTQEDMLANDWCIDPLPELDQSCPVAVQLELLLENVG